MLAFWKTTCSDHDVASRNPTRSSLRIFLQQILIDSSDIERLFIDHFPEQRKYLSRSMTTVEMINCLLSHTETSTVISALMQSDDMAKQLDRYQHLLVEHVSFHSLARQQWHEPTISHTSNAQDFVFRQACALIVIPDQQSRGTGFLIAPDHVLTCWHVVSVDSGQIILAIFDEIEYRAIITYKDEVADLAILRLERNVSGINPLKISNTTMTSGAR